MFWHDEDDYSLAFGDEKERKNQLKYLCNSFSTNITEICFQLSIT